MKNDRKENLRLLQLAAQGKLTKEDLLKDYGPEEYTIELCLDGNKSYEQMQIDWAAEDIKRKETGRPPVTHVTLDLR